jgi:acetyl esterase/lipase
MTGPDETTLALDAVRARIASVFGAWTRETTLAEMRAGFDAMLATTLEAQAQTLSVGAMNAVRIRGEAGTARGSVLYFHGGGYQIGSTVSHREIMIRLSRAAGCDVVGFDYRLAPENRFPAAVEDGVAAWRWLLEQGASAQSVAFAGDSAGGGLAVATMLAARSQGLPLPARAVLMSPWLDMEASGETYRTRAEVDPLSRRETILAMARAYIGRAGDPRDPLASPIHADLAGLPPFLIHVGDHETVLDDSRVFTDRLGAAGVPVELVVWERMIHHFQLFPELPEAHRSIAAIGAFLRERLG